MKFIKDIEQDKEISSYFRKYSNTKDKIYISKIIEYIKKSKIARIDFDFDDINLLLYSDETKKTFLDYLIENYDILSYNLQRKLAENEIYVHKCIDKGIFEIVDDISDKILLKEYDIWNTLFDYLLHVDKLSPNIIERLGTNEGIIKKINAKDPKLLCYLKGDILFSQKIDGIRIIEYLFKENIIEPDTITRIYYNKEIYDLCIKYNREDLLSYITESCFLYKKNGQYIIEELLDKKVVPKCRCYDTISYKLFYKRGIFNKLIEANEPELLSVIDNNTLLEILLKKGLTPLCRHFTYLESLNIMLKYKRYDLLVRCSLSSLLTIKDNNITYLDILLDEVKHGLNVRLGVIDTYNAELKEVAKYYVKLAQHGLIKYVNPVTEEELLNESKGLKFIEYLLKEDKELTINVILREKVKENLDIATLLRSRKIEQKIIDFEPYYHSLVDDYYQKYHDYLASFQVTDEEQELLDELKSLMLKDNKSDKDFVEYMINEYRYLLSVKNEYGERELRQLIEIKRNVPNFCIRKAKKEAYYSNYSKSINLENGCVEVLNHETGHALFHILTERKVPKEFEKIVYQIRNNPKTKEKVRTYSIKILEIKNSVENVVHEVLENYEPTEEEKKKINAYLAKCKTEKRKEYLQNGYSKDKIEEILNETYNLEEYINSSKKKEERELTDAILRTRYGSFIALGDILDAIFIGKYKSEALIYNNENVIPEGYGHGIAYFEKGITTMFDETIANFSSIIKSYDAIETLSYLKDITGEAFVNLLENYYKNEICLKKMIYFQHIKKPNNKK